MEDKLKIIHSAKDEVQQMNSQQACVISELQTKNNSMSMNVDNLKRQIESLQQVGQLTSIIRFLCRFLIFVNR